MSDLEFMVGAEWQGDARAGRGILTTGAQRVVYSSPSSMGGNGAGTNPEELLIAAVASCYSIGLAALLQKAGLPVASIEVQATALITGFPLATAFNKIIVSPTITSARPARAAKYEKAAQTARDRCFIGRMLPKAVVYEVGIVTTVASSRTTVSQRGGGTVPTP